MTFVVGTSGSPSKHTLHIFTIYNKRFHETKLFDYVCEYLNSSIQMQDTFMTCLGNKHLWFDVLHQTPKAP
jgi:hypothetical protein